jgi:hypothetical protein
VLSWGMGDGSLGLLIPQTQHYPIPGMGTERSLWARRRRVGSEGWVLEDPDQGGVRGAHGWVGGGQACAGRGRARAQACPVSVHMEPFCRVVLEQCHGFQGTCPKR